MELAQTYWETQRAFLKSLQKALAKSSLLLKAANKPGQTTSKAEATAAKQRHAKQVKERAAEIQRVRASRVLEVLGPSGVR